MKINSMNRDQIRDRLHELAKQGQVIESERGFVPLSDYARRLVERFYGLKKQEAA